MKQEIYYCDICHQQVDKDKLYIGYSVNVMNSFVPAKDDTRYTNEKLDLCDICLDLCTPVVRYNDGKFKVRDYNKNGYMQ